ncbi:uncharacterized protein LOC124111278 [Haliotis rufescens]|uniref:uncharacterized protein LOC124111278 n=1 Tax=Haliotis rufescens TaxID=6454 RepID=UPI00201EBC65|nr:uncharacterized protein LOC124111278 [Haliotis rufescens]
MMFKIVLLWLLVAGERCGATGPESTPTATACTERLKQVPGHTACLKPSPLVKVSGVSEDEKKIIIDEHNRYRSIVQPTATNMLKVYWNEELALIAQAWASNCKVEHDAMGNRNIPGVYQIGQNWAMDYRNWTQSIAGWHSEVKSFTYNGTNVPDEVGHYTQLVWADTTRVGCGFAKCNTTLFYVCNYAPAGNRGGYKIPYKKGTPAAECKQTDNHLCDCGGKACENGGTLNRTTCACKCIVDNVYVGDVCKLDCENATVKEPYYCNHTAYVEENCPRIADVPDRCPKLCHKCPYGDYRYDYNERKPGTPTTTITTTITTTPKPPRVCKDKFSVHRGHSACLQPSKRLNQTVADMNISSSDIELILQQHNMHRQNVTPSARNMMKLTWDAEIAMVARVWAEACEEGSDEPSHRTIPGRFRLGQNIAAGLDSWTDAINTWWHSGKDFVYGSNTNVDKTAPYTQLVWESTTRIGCGFADCDGRFVYVCNYGPSGNTRKDNSKPYTNGTTCGACTSNCDDGLCNCGDKYCENDGIMDPSECTCSCKTEFNQHPGCTLSCDDVTEPFFCNEETFPDDACTRNPLAQVFCPILCNVCPYADPNYVDVGATPPPPTHPPIDPFPCGPIQAAAHLEVQMRIVIVSFVIAVTTSLF